MACIIERWQDNSNSIIRVMYSSFLSQFTAQPNEKNFLIFNFKKYNKELILYFYLVNDIHIKPHITNNYKLLSKLQ